MLRCLSAASTVAYLQWQRARMEKAHHWEVGPLATVMLEAAKKRLGKVVDKDGPVQL